MCSTPIVCSTPMEWLFTYAHRAADYSEESP
ncbi:hypothetical protein H0P51_23505 [Mycobacterium vicinigordonae]|uniref:Uncharacterized protein n=1 Tax=Mycobacterium vicinigordonae TaxID=1719132 RepID=A0A7D6HNT9_9MYCO|nr:hypothetical protein H0P51_23505 [Mycobacterium vicinigordonae]